MLKVRVEAGLAERGKEVVHHGRLILVSESKERTVTNACIVGRLNFHPFPSAACNLLKLTLLIQLTLLLTKS